jgi:hypothetical protein
MPSYDKHVAQAKHNRSLVTELSADYCDWIVTVCFYSVLHMVEAMIYECEHLRAPSNPLPRFSTQRTLVKISGVKHSSELSKNYCRNGHELRDCLISDNFWYFKGVGRSCMILRGVSQSARYDCQEIDGDDADFARDKLFEAVTDFNAWAIPKNLETV